MDSRMINFQILFHTSKKLVNFSVLVLLIVLSLLSNINAEDVCNGGKFGPSCGFDCNCELSCDQTSGKCSMCKPGWYGPNCQMKNLALNKPARLRKFPNEMAQQLVDGDRENTCLSVSGVETQRLKIDLEAQYSLHHVTIFDIQDRDPSERIWAKGLMITMGNSTVLKEAETCHEHNEEFPQDGILNINCDVTGQHLYVIKKTLPKELKICEVEAYVCSDFTWGNECENFCGYCKDGITCDQKSGDCPNGCNDGWYGNRCDLKNGFREILLNVGLQSTETSTDVTTATEQTTTDVTQTTTQNTESTTQATESTTQVTESTTQATESTTQVTESTSQVTDSTTQVTESTTQATESTTQATTSESTSTSQATESTTDTSDISTTSTDASSSQQTTTMSDGTTTAMSSESTSPSTTMSSTSSELTTTDGSTTNMMTTQSASTTTTEVLTTSMTSTDVTTTDSSTSLLSTETTTASMSTTESTPSSISSTEKTQTSISSTAQTTTTASIDSTTNSNPSTTSLTSTAPTTVSSTAGSMETSTATDSMTTMETTSTTDNTPMSTTLTAAADTTTTTMSSTVTNPSVVSVSSTEVSSSTTDSLSTGTTATEVTTPSMTSTESTSMSTSISQSTDTTTENQYTSASVSTAGSLETTTVTEGTTSTMGSMGTTASVESTSDDSSTEVSTTSYTGTTVSTTMATSTEITSAGLNSITTGSVETTTPIGVITSSSPETTASDVTTESFSSTEGITLSTASTSSAMTSEGSSTLSSSSTVSESDTAPSATTMTAGTTMSMPTADTTSISDITQTTSTVSTATTGTAEITPVVTTQMSSTELSSAGVSMSTSERSTISTKDISTVTEKLTTSLKDMTTQTFTTETGAMTTTGVNGQPVTASTATASSNQAVIIAVAVIVPILLIIIIVVIVLFVIKKRKKSADLVSLHEYRTTKPDGSMSVVNETTSLTSPSRNNSQGSLGSLGTENANLATFGYSNGTLQAKKATPVNKLHGYVQTMMKKKGFEKEYKSLAAGMVYPHKDGLLEENRSKNRYINMIAYDHSRVYLDKEDGDYINANYIDGFIRRSAYIATQGPTRNTTEDFWHMIWQEEVGKIVMLTNLVESNKVKCYKYWPSEESDLLFNSLQISLNSEETYPSFVIRKISLIDVELNETRNITQFHFTAWPDHGVPDPFQIMVFHRKILQQNSSTLGGPMVVHCSAGIGRTGTLIALDSLYKQGEASYYLSFNQYVREMRQNRVNMVQTMSQYIFIHTTMLEMFACHKDPVIARDMFYQVWADPMFKDKVHDEYISLMELRPEFEERDYSIGQDPVNIDKHRDLAVIAADKYRAYLQSYSVSRTDYINAVILPSHYSQQGYILTQFPLKSTIIDLWQMLYDYQSNVVVIADILHFDEQESGVFWPAIGESLTLGAFVIHCVAQTGNRDLTFNLSNKKADEYSKKSLDIRVLIGAGWSEIQDVPSDADYWFELHNDIHKWQESQGQRPITVLCRNGGSRGALYCAVSNVLDGLDIYQDVDVFHVFRQIHNRKPEVLEFKEQYEHCYEVARLYLDAGSLYSS